MAQGPTGILTGHFHENDAYGISRPEGMDSWLLVYTIDGGGFFRTPEGEKRCGPGEAALLRTGTPHMYGTVPGGQWHFVWAHFDRLPQTGLLPDEEVVVCPIAHGGSRRQFLRTFRQLLQDSRDRGPFWRELCENHLSRLLLLLAQRLTDGLDPGSGRRRGCCPSG
jgi:AraC family transcriptional regulator of arabinose operon